MKHFPGIGCATQNTDSYVVTISGSASHASRPGLLPYQTAIGHHIPMIMLSNATYTAYDPANGAGWSAAIVRTCSATSSGFQGVTITDSLDGTAHARGIPVGTLATRRRRGRDGHDPDHRQRDTRRRVYAHLLADATAGHISRARSSRRTTGSSP